VAQNWQLLRTMFPGRLTMRRVGSIFGLTVATCLAGCQLGEPPATSYVARPVPDAPAIDSRALLRASLTCIMAPILHDMAKVPGDPSTAFDAEATSCFKAARAAQIRPVRLYRLDADAMQEVRRVIAQNRGDSYAARDIDEMLSVYDMSIAAVAEGRRAHALLARKAPDLTSDDIDKIRAHHLVVALDDFGRKSEGPIGVDARAVAALIAANDFLLVSRVRPAQRPFAAEPLFCMFFGAEFVSERPDAAPAPWPDYVSAAARAIEPSSPSSAGGIVDPWAGTEGSSARPAVGGGPGAADELAQEGAIDPRTGLRAVTSLVSAHLQSLAQRLPDGEIRSALERTIGHYVAFDVDEALSPVSELASTPH
jgi:hypothetical protein